ncbi:bifunctional methylenetetrahydrofolate dehydrogenase/methenyltetrahydrofolate cyclohydrolase FolD [Paenisporosarcina cavernae]|uniref:Bifunctional protein FolD n=1 Tax=Paenisporosarcina cavernae TaxID=2320858 RepID=A0A385YSR7_9BACL|nr:bifunctional methylenetetrahydrofolate dehydrogenase/methenyltetrahydrofolate cyclohydrolase FolD [Paenisporosarcina cavernae]AYC29541.1 bifunctional methylenetetrahydrofolate dehydrogenase/methenyltetrahydrofolate cyclohydrolase FolD [Paenisporosarcina cavernae]
MVNNILDGKKIASSIQSDIEQQVKTLKQSGVVPGLTVIIVGDNPASITYVTNKKRTSERLGMNSALLELPESTTELELVNKIVELNNDPTVHGILVQLPLPRHIDESKIIHAISPEKDVDGFHPINVGKFVIGEESFLPCTPYGIMEMLHFEGIDVAGKHVVVVGRSNIVGKPMGLMMLKNNATVTYVHSKTVDVSSITKQADILIVAVGKAKFITSEFVKDGAIVIDVGMNRDENGKLCGDVDFENVRNIASFITPVPGGVGPMTITMLMKNTLESAKKLST